MGRGIGSAALLLAVALAAKSAFAAPPASGLHPGEKLTYDLSLEMQIHAQPSPHSTQGPVTLESTAQGTETLTVLRADPDGVVHTTLDLDLQLMSGGRTQPLHRVVLIKIAPDETPTVEGGGDQAMAQYLSAFAVAARVYDQHALHVGDVFHQSTNVPGAFPVTVNSTLKVVGEKAYRGYPTFAIQATGSGLLHTTVQGSAMNGTLTTAGTIYYDQRDHLLVGVAMRVNVSALLSGQQGGRLTVTETLNFVLSALTRSAAATPTPAASASPAPAATPSATASPQPAPTPTSGYYTPPPPSPTPPPNPYPPG